MSPVPVFPPLGRLPRLLVRLGSRLGPHFLLPSPRLPRPSQQFGARINQVQTIRAQSFPVLPSTSCFMARYAPVAVSLPPWTERSVVYTRACALVSATGAVNTSVGDDVINYKPS